MPWRRFLVSNKRNLLIEIRSILNEKVHRCYLLGYQLKSDLQMKFEAKDMGPIKVCLGLNISQDIDKWTIHVDQMDYIVKLLEKFDMLDCKEVSTPMQPGRFLEKGEKGKSFPKFREIIGGLMYLATCSKPDISYAIGYLSRFLDCSDDEHLTAAKRILQYLKKTIKYKMIYSHRRTDKLMISAYSDADWGSCKEDRRSVSGVVINISGGSVVWTSKKQSITAVSTMEAEYVAASEAIKDIMWLRNVLSELETTFDAVLNLDNQATIVNLKDARNSSKLKHVDIRLHFAREAVMNGLLSVVYCNTNDNPADFLTKPVTEDKIKNGCHSVGLKEIGGEEEHWNTPPIGESSTHGD